MSSAGAAAFQMGRLLSRGPPFWWRGSAGPAGSRHTAQRCVPGAALTYKGSEYAAFPAAATCPMYFATAQLWKQTSASGPNTSCQFGDEAPGGTCIALRTSAGTGPSKSFCAGGE